MSGSQRQSTARQASAKQVAQERPPLRETEPEDEIGKLLGFQNGFGNQVAKRAGDGCPNLAACPTGGACEECRQKSNGDHATTGPAGRDHDTAPSVILSAARDLGDGALSRAGTDGAPAQILRSAQDDREGARAEPSRDREAAPAPTRDAAPTLDREATPAQSGEPTPALDREAAPARGSEAAPARDGAAVPARDGAESPASDSDAAPSVIPSAARDLGGEAAPEAVAASAEPPTSFLVDDPASATDSTQVGKAVFLAELKSQVSAAAEGELAGTGRTAADCPWIQYWFGYFEHRSAERVENALRRYAPEAAEARDASEYMPPVVERVRSAVAHWVATGEVTGVPHEGLASLAQAAVATGSSAVPTSAASLFFKAREGGARQPRDLQALQARLGEGEALDAPVRSRMESAFGTSLGGVRVHRDANAAALSSEVNARAFALGDHVAFGAGEYRPGSVVGDALIAHELAHVVQQQSGGSGGSADYGALEADADRSAAGVVASMWSGAREGLAGMAERTGPALRSGLRLQRCGDSPTPTPTPGGCVTGNLTAKTSGPFQGGWNANSYLSGGQTWGPMADPSTAGPDGTSYKVQMTAPFSGPENLGVSQSLTFSNANQAWRDDFAAYSGQPAGSVANGTSQNEPVLDASDPFAVKPWFLRYKDGIVSFCDVPIARGGRKGSIDFLTTFHSRGASCGKRRCSVVWRWTIDTTTATTTNTATQQSQSCQ